MKKTYQWCWKGKYIPIQKLHYNQLFSIIKSLNNPNFKFNSPINKEEWNKAIKNELKIRSQKDTNEVIKMIERNHVIKAKKTVNQLIKQFKNAKIF